MALLCYLLSILQCGMTNPDGVCSDHFRRPVSIVISALNTARKKQAEKLSMIDFNQ